MQMQNFKSKKETKSKKQFMDLVSNKVLITETTMLACGAEMELH